jgi:hypothetical protein
MIADMELAESHTPPIVKLRFRIPSFPRLTESRLAAFDMSLPHCDLNAPSRDRKQNPRSPDFLGPNHRKIPRVNLIDVDRLGRLCGCHYRCREARRKIYIAIVLREE